jgi:hypothetical protein
MRMDYLPASIQLRIAESVKAYQVALEQYDDAQWEKVPGNGGWTLSQMFAHLIGSHGAFFSRMIKYCKEQRNGEIGGEMNDAGKKIFHFNSLPPVKIKMPEVLNTGAQQNITLQDATAELNKIASGLDLLREWVESATENYKIKHPVIGPLNATEWFAMCDMHWRHHFRQKQELEQNS